MTVRMDELREEYIGGAVHVIQSGAMVREARWRWPGSVLRNEEVHVYGG